MNDSNIISDLLTTPEVAGLLRVSKSTINRLVEKRLVRFYKVRGSRRFRRADILAYLENNCIESIEDAYGKKIN